MKHSRVAIRKQDIINIHQKIKVISAIKQDKQGGVNLGGVKTKRVENNSDECTMTSVPVLNHTTICIIGTHEMEE
jgi:hypothetical protein